MDLAESQEALAEQHEQAAARQHQTALHWDERDQERAELERRGEQLSLQAAELARDKARWSRANAARS